MMEHVVMLQIEPEFTLEIVVMKRIMRHVVEKITCDETCEEWKYVDRSYQHLEEEIKQECKRYADSWHHDQPFAVAWIVMMDSVKNKVNAFA